MYFLNIINLILFYVGALSLSIHGNIQKVNIKEVRGVTYLDKKNPLDTITRSHVSFIEKFDKNGNYDDKRIYNEFGNLMSSFVFENNRIIRENKHNQMVNRKGKKSKEFGSIKNYYKYTYEGSRLHNKVFFNLMGKVINTRYYYYRDGLLLKSELYFPDDSLKENLSTTTEYKYENEKILSETEYAGKERVIREVKYKYGTEGALIRREVVEDDNFTRNIFEYNYNESGMLIEILKKGYSITKLEYTYYN